MLVCTGCSLTRGVPENAYLYKGAKVKIIKKDKKIDAKKLKSTYETVVKSPSPNKRFLGVHWKLQNYNNHLNKKRKNPKKQDKEYGEPPVLYDEKVIEQVAILLANKAFNNGFFNTKVTKVIKQKRKKAWVTYTVEVDQPYTIGTIENKVANAGIKNEIVQIQSKTLLQEGQPYNLPLLKKERKRISDALRQAGYYFFREDYLKFKADTTQNNKQVGLALALKEGIAPSNLVQQTIQEIYVFPNANQASVYTEKLDTLKYDGLTIIFQKELIKPSVLRNAITFKKGALYQSKIHQNTLRRLSYLQNYQFIDVQFKPAKNQENALITTIRLTPRKPHTVEGSLGLSLKSGFYIGPEASLSYLHRNLFKGAEQFRFTTFGNFNFPLSDRVSSLNEVGATVSLTKPGLFLPFVQFKQSSEVVAKTKLSFTYANEKAQLPLSLLTSVLVENDFPNLSDQLRQDSSFTPFFALNNFDINVSYFWRKRVDLLQELNPINISVQRPQYEFQELKELLILLALLNENLEGAVLNLEEMVIFKPNYIFQYDSRLKQLKKNNFFYQGKIGFIGNRLLSNSNLIPAEFIQNQFTQIESDFRYFWRPNANQTLAFRFAANAILPFQDRVVLPFFDLYKIGGPNSIRAFQPRLVGPGSVVPNEDFLFFTGVGDVLLESNIEWRPKLSELFELGIFMDAGNVWQLKVAPDNNKLGLFELKDFYKELAIGSGVGLRLNYDILVLRFDLAFPLTKPWLPEGERWVGNEFDIGSRTWRQNNLTFNLAFGYSF